MPETITPERSALLLADASRFIGRALHAWPEKFSLDNLAVLIAKGRNGDKQADFRLWRDRIAVAIHEKHLIPKIEKLPAAPARLIITGGRGISPHSIHRQPERSERDLVSIARADAAQWLDRISFDVDNHAHVRAWLGDAWNVSKQDAAPLVGTGDTLRPEKRTRAALTKDLQAEWPTIQRDLQDASRNGLAKKARLVGERGWDKVQAIEWATEKGKLTKQGEATWFSHSPIATKATKRRSR